MSRNRIALVSIFLMLTLFVFAYIVINIKSDSFKKFKEIILNNKHLDSSYSDNNTTYPDSGYVDNFDTEVTGKIAVLSVNPILIYLNEGSSENISKTDRYSLEYSSGHYLLHRFQEGSLIYDGKLVAKGNILDSRISNNGLHYTYTVVDSKFNVSDSNIFSKIVPTKIYVNDQIKISSLNTSILGVSNDGIDVYYFSGEPYVKDNDFETIDLMKNNETLEDSVLTDELVASLNPKGISIKPNTSDDTLCKKDILKEYVMSPNGRHTARICYSADRRVYYMLFDGKKVRESRLIDSVQITDTGHYSVVDRSNGYTLILDEKKYDIDDTVLGLPTFDKDLKNYAVLTNKGILVSGKYISLTKEVEKLVLDENTLVQMEIDGETLNLYLLIK